MVICEVGSKCAGFGSAVELDQHALQDGSLVYPHKRNCGPRSRYVDGRRQELGFKIVEYDDLQKLSSDLARWVQRMLLRWRRSTQAWRLLSTAGHNPGLGTSLQSTTATGELMEELRNLYSGYRRTWLPLEMRGRPVAISAEVYVSGRSGLALIDLERTRMMPQLRSQGAGPGYKSRTPSSATNSTPRAFGTIPDATTPYSPR